MKHEISGGEQLAKSLDSRLRSSGGHGDRRARSASEETSDDGPGLQASGVGDPEGDGRHGAGRRRDTAVRVVANRFGHAYVTGTQPVSITVNDQTRIRFQGTKGLTALRALVVNDRVKIEARVCKADLANGATPALTAKRLVAHTPAA